MNEAVRHMGLPLEDALTSDQPVAACFARIAYSTAAEGLCQLVNAELDRNTEPAALLTALAIWSVQTHASVTAQIIGPDTCHTMAELYETILRGEYLHHVQKTRNSIQEAAAL